MATQMSKIKKKLQKPEEKVEESSLKPKPGKDMMLIALICVTVLIMLLGYNDMSGMDIGLYSALLGSTLCLYFSRHLPNASEQTEKNLRYVSFFFLGLVFIVVLASLFISW